MKTRAPLKWDHRMIPGSLVGCRGDRIIATIVQITGVEKSHPRYGVFRWSISAVHMKWIGKGYGDSTTEAAARRAANRAWAGWCKTMGLVGEEIVLD